MVTLLGRLHRLSHLEVAGEQQVSRGEEAHSNRRGWGERGASRSVSLPKTAGGPVQTCRCPVPLLLPCRMPP